MIFRWLVLTLPLALALPAEARVFSFAKENVAVYFKGDAGLLKLGKSGYSKSSGTSTEFTAEPNFGYGGEFGVLLTLNAVGLRLGVTGITSRKMDGIEGKNAAGTLLMTMSSQAIAYAPSAHFEFGLKNTNTQRFFVSLGGGYAYVSLINDYRLTSSGTSTYPGIVDYTEEGTGNAIFGDVSLSYEFSMTDNVAMLLDLGYRYLQVSRLTHGRAATTFLGPVATGDVVRNSDGTNRTLDLNSPFFGIGFRFYLGI